MWEMEGLVDLCFGLGGQAGDGVVEEVVENILAEFDLSVVCKLVSQCSAPGWIAVDCTVCWCEEGGAVEFVEGRDETSALEEPEERGVIFVGVEGVDEGCGEGLLLL
jgi:hypothetical protein